MALSSRQDHQEFENLIMENDIEEGAVHVQLAVVVSEALSSRWSLMAILQNGLLLCRFSELIAGTSAIHRGSHGPQRCFAAC
jgi:hypothetical protein